ncbi:C40 family peptidase [Stappia sp. F7233]|uniref:C40 family peptidase n=1 Tax=Stappia albiluteola TaxID=2758565 RepID=A0A839A9K5_9HYPH|nr:NlpC/P60 family protein [Stappia albiluteola]MBA5776223.1 C40 family peptidase [Stappia albiluteola]
MTESLDRRLHPVRPDLAAKAYEGRVTADRFVEGETRRVAADLVDLKGAPRPDKSIDTQALFGETVTVYEENAEGWAWGQLATDGYVGWMPASALAGPAALSLPTHRVMALRTYRYPYAELKSPPLGILSLGALVSVVDRQTLRGLDYAVLSDGSAVVERHLVPAGHRVEDWVAVAEALTGTPYLWGGRSSLGLDCSALVQLAAQAGGMALPRDSDMQETSAGETLDIGNGLPELERGDLIFWKGHVGIMRDRETLIHANGFAMAVTSEPLADVARRIREREGHAISTVRRLVAS